MKQCPICKNQFEVGALRFKHFNEVESICLKCYTKNNEVE